MKRNTQGVNFIKILRARFLYKSALSSFSQLCFGFGKRISEKALSYKKRAHKMLMKLTVGGR